MFRLVFLILLVTVPGAVRAEMGTLFGGAALFRVPTALIQARAEAPEALIQVRGEAPDMTQRRSGSSLFIGQAGGGMFAPLPARIRERRPFEADQPTLPMLSGTPIERLRQLIQHAESRHHGYDAVQFGARIKPSRAPTQMTIAEIYRWIEATPGQPHAIGRYQFIPSTLRRVVRQAGAREDQMFSPQVQDRLGDVLLVEAGLNEFATGRMTRKTFMENLAKIWAGLPTSTGRSFYDGYAGNKSSISWAQYDAEMQRIFSG